MRATFQNSAMLLSIGIFFSIIIAALSVHLPQTLANGLQQAGLPAAEAQRVAHVPPTAALFAAFLGFNPVKRLVPASALENLPPAEREHLLRDNFFPQLFGHPFMIGLRWAFYVSAAMCAIAAIVSSLRGERYYHAE